MAPTEKALQLKQLKLVLMGVTVATFTALTIASLVKMLILLGERAEIYQSKSLIVLITMGVICVQALLSGITAASVWYEWTCWIIFIIVCHCLAALASCVLLMGVITSGSLLGYGMLGILYNFLSIFGYTKLWELSWLKMAQPQLFAETSGDESVELGPQQPANGNAVVYTRF